MRASLQGMPCAVQHDSISCRRRSGMSWIVLGLRCACMHAFYETLPFFAGAAFRKAMVSMARAQGAHFVIVDLGPHTDVLHKVRWRWYGVCNGASVLMEGSVEVGRVEIAAAQAACRC